MDFIVTLCTFLHRDSG